MLRWIELVCKEGVPVELGQLSILVLALGILRRLEILELTGFKSSVEDGATFALKILLAWHIAWGSILKDLSIFAVLGNLVK